MHYEDREGTLFICFDVCSICGIYISLALYLSATINKYHKSTVTLCPACPQVACPWVKLLCPPPASAIPEDMVFIHIGLTHTFHCMCCIRANKPLICFLTQLVTPRGLPAIADAAGNTHTSGATTHIDTFRYIQNKYTHHLDVLSRCVNMKCHHVVASKDGMHQSITQYDRGLISAQKIAHFSSCTLCMYIPMQAHSGSKVSTLRVKGEWPG